MLAVDVAMGCSGNNGPEPSGGGFGTGRRRVVDDRTRNQRVEDPRAADGVGVRLKQVTVEDHKVCREPRFQLSGQAIAFERGLRLILDDVENIIAADETRSGATAPD